MIVNLSRINVKNVKIIYFIVWGKKYHNKMVPLGESGKNLDM